MSSGGWNWNVSSTSTDDNNSASNNTLNNNNNSLMNNNNWSNNNDANTSTTNSGSGSSFDNNHSNIDSSWGQNNSNNTSNNNNIWSFGSSNKTNINSNTNTNTNTNANIQTNNNTSTNNNTFSWDTTDNLNSNINNNNTFSCGSNDNSNNSGNNSWTSTWTFGSSSNNNLSSNSNNTSNYNNSDSGWSLGNNKSDSVFSFGNNSTWSWISSNNDNANTQTNNNNSTGSIMDWSEIDKVDLSSCNFIWRIPFIANDKIQLFMHGYLKENKISVALLEIIDILCEYINEQTIMNHIKNSNCGQKFCTNIFCVNSFQFAIVIYPNGLSNDKQSCQSVITLQPLSSQNKLVKYALYLVETNEIITRIMAKRKRQRIEYSKQRRAKAKRETVDTRQDNTSHFIRTDIKSLSSITLGINVTINMVQKSKYWTNPKLEPNYCEFIIQKSSIFNGCTVNYFTMHSFYWCLLITYDGLQFPKSFKLKCFPTDSQIYNIWVYYKLILKQTQTAIDGYNEFEFNKGYENDLGKVCCGELGEMSLKTEDLLQLIMNTSSFTFKLGLSIIDIKTRNNQKLKTSNQKPKVYYLPQNEFVWTIGSLTDQEFRLLCSGYAKPKYAPQEIIDIIHYFYQNCQNQNNMGDFVKSFKTTQSIKSSAFSVDECKFFIQFIPKRKTVINPKYCMQKLDQFGTNNNDKTLYYKKHSDRMAAFSIHLVGTPACSSSVYIDHHSIICNSATNQNIAHFRHVFVFSDTKSICTMYIPVSWFEGIKKISFKIKLRVLNILDRNKNSISPNNPPQQIQFLSTPPIDEYLWNISSAELKMSVLKKVFMMHGFEWRITCKNKTFTVELITNSKQISSVNFICSLFVDDEMESGYIKCLYFRQKNLHMTGNDKFAHEVVFRPRMTGNDTIFKLVIEVTEICDSL